MGTEERREHEDTRTPWVINVFNGKRILTNDLGADRFRVARTRLTLAIKDKEDKMNNLKSKPPRRPRDGL